MSIGARGQSGQTSELASGRQTDVSQTERGGGGGGGGSLRPFFIEKFSPPPPPPPPIYFPLFSFPSSRTLRIIQIKRPIPNVSPV